jgi:uncharacterized protein YceK
MSRALVVLIFSMTLVSQSGCGTIANLNEERGCHVLWREFPPAKRIFGGVQIGAEGVADWYKETLDAGELTPTSFAGFVIGISIIGIDLPLSAAGDVLTLPVTIPATLSRMKKLRQADPKSEPALTQSRG